jgi:HD superfamily phosphohydrolase
MSQPREIRDPIHGFVRLLGRECDIVDTPLFQRLRRIHQLAMAYMVYPGALHTRFDHTLGVTDVAGRMCDHLRIDEGHRTLVRMAGLLHDVGHGPFSHVSESVLNALSEPELEKTAGKKEKIHELITEKIIRQHPDLSGPLSGNDREEVAKLLKSGLDEAVHRDIISGPLDADKQDYLLRDSKYCGVTYGIFDISQLHLTLCQGRQDGNRHLMVKENGIHALEQFVLAKYYLTTQVYRHKVRLITDQMLVRAISLGVESDKIPDLEKLYRYKDTQEYIDNYLKWDDYRLTTELLRTDYEGTKCGRMFRRLVERNLFKVIFQIPLTDGRFKGSAVPVALPEQFPAIKKDMESQIAGELSKILSEDVESDFVILHFYSIQSVRKQSRNDEKAIMIDMSDVPEPFEHRSRLFQSINVGMNEEFIECYAPCNLTDEMKKNDLRNEMRKFAVSWLLKRFSASEDSKLDSKPQDNVVVS